MSPASHRQSFCVDASKQRPRAACRSCPRLSRLALEGYFDISVRELSALTALSVAVVPDDTPDDYRPREDLTLDLPQGKDLSLDLPPGLTRLRELRVCGASLNPTP